MFKKLLSISFFLSFFLSFFVSFGFTTEYFEADTIYSEELNDAVNANGIDDPLRNGTTNIGGNTQGIAMNGVINNSNDAKNQTTEFISKIVNRFLLLLGLVALIYLMYHGFMILTAAGDDAKYKKGMKGIQIAMIALAGIGFSRFIISLILKVLSISVGP